VAGGEKASAATSSLVRYFDEEVITGYDETASYKIWIWVSARGAAPVLLPEACATGSGFG
jgi:hypothetical protein